MNEVNRIDCKKASEISLQHGSQIIDIRDEESYLSGHIAGAIHIDNSSLNQFMTSSDPTQPLLIYCYHGNSSQQAAQYFIEKGFEQVYSVDGGFEQWKKTAPPAI